MANALRQGVDVGVTLSPPPCPQQRESSCSQARWPSLHCAGCVVTGSPAEANADRCSVVSAACSSQAEVRSPCCPPCGDHTPQSLSQRSREGRRGARALRLSQLSCLFPPRLTWVPRCRRGEAGQSAAETQVGVKVPGPCGACPSRGQASTVVSTCQKSWGVGASTSAPQPQGPRALCTWSPPGVPTALPAQPQVGTAFSLVLDRARSRKIR